jgi:hypothetical protein
MRQKHSKGDHFVAAAPLWAATAKGLKDHGYWMDDMGDSIDGQQGVIVADFMHFGGNDSHFGIDFGDGAMVGVHPEWVKRVCYFFFGESSNEQFTLVRKHPAAPIRSIRSLARRSGG